MLPTQIYTDRLNKLFLVLAVLLTQIPLLAQIDVDAPAEVRWGALMTEPANTRINSLVSANRYGTYILRQQTAGAIRREKFFLEYYDAESLRLQRSTELPLRHKGKDMVYESTLMLGDQFHFFTSYNNQAQKTNYLFYRTFDQQLNPVGQLTKIAEMDSRNVANTGDFNLLLSEDSTKLLLYNQLANKRSEPERFALRVLDTDLQLLWKKDITLPYNDQQFVVEDYQVDERGNVYLVCALFNDGTRERRAGKPNYQYLVLAYTDGGDTFKEYLLDIKDQFITDMTVRVAKDGTLVCAGFYSDRGTASIKGTCFFRLNPQTQQVYDLNLREFEFEFRSGMMRNRQRQRAAQAEQGNDASQQAELFRMSLDELILRSDGGAVLVAEQFYIRQRQYQNWGGIGVGPIWHTDFIYHYNDIIVVNIRPDGSIEWASRIPKLQETINDGGFYSSYAMAVTRSGLFFLFNDNDRNYGDGGSDRLYGFNGRNSIMTLAQIDINGELSMHPLLGNRGTGIIARPKFCQQIGSRKMMLYGELGRRYRLAELNFE